MTIELKDLSLEDLMRLEKLVENEKRLRGNNTKDSLSSCSSFFHALDPDEKSDTASDIAWRMNKDVIELCDFALRNYDITITQKKREKVLRRTNHIYKVDFQTYKSMVEELREVVMKYIVPIKEEQK